MKKILTLALAALMLMLVAACSQGTETKNNVNASAALWESSTLNKVLKSGVLRVGLEAGYMPFEMRDKKGDIIGFDVDLAAKMAEAMGVKLELVNTAWDGIIPALMTDKFDILMSGMTVTAERNLQINFVDSYVTVGQTLLIRPELAGKIKSYLDLNDPKYTVATKLGVTPNFTAQKMMPKAKLNLFETETEAFMEVVNGRADAFIYDLPMCATFYAQNKGKVVFLDKPFTFEPLAFAIRKGDPDFANWLNNWLRQIKGDGTYETIYNAWFKDDAWMKELQ